MRFGFVGCKQIPRTSLTLISRVLISGFTSLGQTPQLHPSTERALRQCIRQLELLKTVWLDVLPVNVYCKAVGELDPILVVSSHDALEKRHVSNFIFLMSTRVIGCITNSMIDDLVTKVISVEDIPVDVARELVVLFNVVVKRTPQIFPVSDCSKNVKFMSDSISGMKNCRLEIKIRFWLVGSSFNYYFCAYFLLLADNIFKSY